MEVGAGYPCTIGVRLGEMNPFNLKIFTKSLLDEKIIKKNRLGKKKVYFCQSK
jgi:hypothetical protein